MNIVDTEIKDVKIIEPRVFGDERGFFVETWNVDHFVKLGIHANFVQDNHSRSGKGVLRGLHYQVKQTQGKLIRVLHGEVYDVAVDMRRSSPTFGKHVGVLLNDVNMRMVWVPPGFAHGFVVLSETADFLYKCTDFYAPQFERTILWNDSELNIDWHLHGLAPILSSKDLCGLPFSKGEAFE